MKGQVLVDSNAFKASFEELLAKASKSVHIQAMSFEGDSVGEWLIDTLIASGVPNIHLCLDSYSKFVINDHFIYSLHYLRNAKFRKEVKNTATILEKAKSNGIKVTFTNPLGFLFLKYPHRNHKKMVVIDGEVSFIGGLNFCEHNFAWHDMMIEMHSEDIATSLMNDFEHTVAENDQSLTEKHINTRLYYLDGYRSKKLYDKIFQNINEATQTIQVFSPYVSDPLLSYIRKNKPEHVKVDISSPGINNKNIFKSILSKELEKGYFNFYEYQGRMSHLKAILIDGRKLIAGSSNFDFISYYFEEEVVMVTENHGIVQDFIEKIAEPDINKSFNKKNLGGTPNFIVPLLIKGISKLSQVVASIINIRHYKEWQN
jgi:cardiolipin synthase